MSPQEPMHNLSDKLESSQAHAKKALDTTTAAAREIADSARVLAHSAYCESKDELSAAARDVKHAASATYASFADQTSAVTNKWCERASEIEEELIEHVREKPLQAIGVAFGIGFFLAIILNRK